MKTLQGIVIMALTSTGACGGQPSQYVPAHVQKMMGATFPADGRIHVKSRGKIAIKPETRVCAVWMAMPESEHGKYFGINSNDLFLPLGQSLTTSDDKYRQVSADSRYCREKREKDTVTIHGVKSDNREGKPYKLVLAVWQGDAVWVGAIERTPKILHEDGKSLVGDIERPHIPPPLEAKLRESIRGDIRDISKKLVNVIGEGVKNEHR